MQRTTQATTERVIRVTAVNFKGLPNVPTSHAKKLEAGLHRQKNSVITTEAARPRQYALIVLVARIARRARDHTHCNGFVTL